MPIRWVSREQMERDGFTLGREFDDVPSYEPEKDAADNANNPSDELEERISD